MKPLFQHASRSFAANVSSINSSSRTVQSFAPSICWNCEYRAAFTPLRNHRVPQLTPKVSQKWSRRAISSSARWMEERGAPNHSRPIPMPPPPTESKSVRQGRVEDTAPEIFSSLDGQERLQEAPDSLFEKTVDEKKPSQNVESATERLSSLESQERLQEEQAVKSDKSPVKDNIERVPDEHLPSHRDKQRWNLSKRLAEAMDEILPKLAVVTQKVNTYTGTDYSGIEALRREIIEQEQLVKSRRAAIDKAKHDLDVAVAKQASAQKEVVALLERKHSWAAGDLERYMSLIRSEHVNDQAVREAKEAAFAADKALEEARSTLEKRERAQYHEEQIWSDTIRRNSTWVTFGLMGVNIFLLLLSLLIFEPWRRRRMVREIKATLESQKAAMEAAPIPSVLPAASAVPSTIAAIEQEIDRVVDAEDSAPEPIVEPIPEVTPEEPLSQQPPPSAADSAKVAAPEPESVPIAIISDQATETSLSEQLTSNVPSEPETWQAKAMAIAQDIVSERIISMRRIDYTTAILQGAAAGGVITAAIIALLRSP